MKVDNGTESQRHSCPGDFVKPMQLVMDDHGSQDNPHRRRSGIRVSTKSKAPSPPVLKGLDAPGLSQRYPGYPHLTMDQKENLIEKDLSLVVVLPGGAEKMTTVHGSKPLMDLLVMLCAKYHLNPSSHTLELVTTNRNHIKFKPNALIGTLEAEKVLLKPKGVEDKSKKTGPQMPEATVRMVINYKKTQKTILRVNPRVPLQEHLLAICEKCEFDIETTILLRDVQSQVPLDLSHSLNDYAIREVYARDMKGFADRPASPVCPSSPTHTDTITPGKDKNQKEKENKGMFSMFRRSKKKSEQATTASAPASPVLVSKPRPLSMALPSTHSSPFNSTTMPTDVPKKRRAPQPPILVSQSCPSDLSTRQRINSALEAQQDSDQMSGGGLSRGSSAESSLKRTKRKAPPPPTSPTVVVQDKASLDGSSQGGAATITLEEIMEQEETTASVISGTVSDRQGDDSSLNLSADVSLDSPSLDAEMLSSPQAEGTGEDQSCDLSSDGKPVQSTVNDDSAVLNDSRLATETNSPELANTESSPCQDEEISQQLTCEESTCENVHGECSSVRCGSPGLAAQPVTQDAETQASVQADTETPGEENDRLERPAATSTPCPPGEDAQVQTDFTPLPVPSQQQQVDRVPSSAELPDSGSVGQKRDMATLTEELNPPDLKPALSHISDTSPCKASTPSAPATTKPTPCYATDSEPKPKPSNELTRDYIPKVGMTTYTIVPQKSLEKLRYFEVELTLESPPVAPESEITDIGSLRLDDCTAQKEDPEVSMEPTELQSAAPREDSPLSDSTTTSPSTVNSSMTEPTDSPSMPTSLPAAEEKISSSTNGGFQAGSPAEVKEMKIPPATKPKPGSFRLAQHKRTPGYYVTSAAVKSLSASPGAGHREAPGSLERGKLPPPPNPPPLQCQEETVGGALVELSPKEDSMRSVPIMGLTRQSSLSSNEPTLGLSLEKLRSFAAPKPYSSTTRSRFAQAVSSAVKRTQSLSHGPKSPSSPMSPPFSPISSRFSIKESKGSSKSKESDNGELDGDKGSMLQGGVNEPPAPAGVQMEGESPLQEECLNHCENQSTLLSTEEPPVLSSGFLESTI